MEFIVEKEIEERARRIQQDTGVIEGIRSKQTDKRGFKTNRQDYHDKLNKGICGWRQRSYSDYSYNYNEYCKQELQRKRDAVER